MPGRVAALLATDGCCSVAIWAGSTGQRNTLIFSKDGVWTWRNSHLCQFGSRDPHSITALIVGLLTLVKSWVVCLANHLKWLS
jgi:hypothetical protein